MPVQPLSGSTKSREALIESKGFYSKVKLSSLDQNSAEDILIIALHRSQIAIYRTRTISPEILLTIIPNHSSYLERREENLARFSNITKAPIVASTTTR